jgi:hypothetical protein
MLCEIQVFLLLLLKCRVVRALHSVVYFYLKYREAWGCNWPIAPTQTWVRRHLSVGLSSF